MGSPSIVPAVLRWSCSSPRASRLTIGAASEYTVRATFVAASIFLLARALVLTRTCRDALFVQEQGLFDLPKAYLGIALLSGPLAFAVLALLRRYGVRTVRVLLPLAAALSLMVFSAFVRPGGGVLMTLFFMFVPLIWGVVFSVSWLLASEVLDGADRHEAAQGFSLIGGAAIVGSAAAGGFATLAAPYSDPRAFLWFAIFGLVGAAAIMREAHRRYPLVWMPRVPADDYGRAVVPSFLAGSYTRALLAVGMAAAIVGVLVEFRFYLAVAASEGADRDNAAYFATFYLVLNVAALVVQLWVLPRVLRRVGLGGALLVLPAVRVGGAAALAMSTSLMVASIVRVTEGGLKSSIHRASWEPAYLPLLPRDRSRTKVIVDGLASRVAEGLAAVVLWLWLRFVVDGSSAADHGTMWITAVLGLGILAWLVATRSLARHAVSLAAGLGDRQQHLHGPPPGS